MQAYAWAWPPRLFSISDMQVMYGRPSTHEHMTDAMSLEKCRCCLVVDNRMADGNARPCFHIKP